jgi:hypothetical protein
MPKLREPEDWDAWMHTYRQLRDANKISMWHGRFSSTAAAKKKSLEEKVVADLRRWNDVNGARYGCSTRMPPLAKDEVLRDGFLPADSVHTPKGGVRIARHAEDSWALGMEALYNEMQQSGKTGRPARDSAAKVGRLGVVKVGHRLTGLRSGTVRASDSELIKIYEYGWDHFVPRDAKGKFGPTNYARLLTLKSSQPTQQQFAAYQARAESAAAVPRAPTDNAAQPGALPGTGDPFSAQSLAQPSLTPYHQQPATYGSDQLQGAWPAGSPGYGQQPAPTTDVWPIAPTTRAGVPDFANGPDALGGPGGYQQVRHYPGPGPVSFQPWPGPVVGYGPPAGSVGYRPPPDTTIAAGSLSTANSGYEWQARGYERPGGSPGPTGGDRGPQPVPYQSVPYQSGPAGGRGYAPGG